MSIRLGIFCMMVIAISACVRPIEPTPIPSPTVYQSPTPPAPVVGPTLPPDPIAVWLQQNLGIVVSNLNFFTQLQVGPDSIAGYTFQDATGQLCVGFAQTTPGGETVWTADYRCAPAGTTVIAAPLLFALTNGDFYVATYGYVDPNTAPQANAYGLEFPDGGTIGDVLTNYGFIALRQGLNFPNLLTIITEPGNKVVTIPVQ